MITDPWFYSFSRLINKMRERKLTSYICRRVYMSILHWVQRRLWGFDDSATYSLDNHIARLLIPRLKRFKVKVIPSGYPNSAGSPEKWEAIIDEMIEGFELIASGRFYEVPISGQEGISKKMTRSLELFQKHYFDLFW